MLNFIISLFIGLNEILTLGGASASREARNLLIEERGRYQKRYADLTDKKEELNQHIAFIGYKLITAKRHLAKIERILGKKFHTKNHQWSTPDPKMFEDIKRFKKNFDRASPGGIFLNVFGLGAGVGTGGLLSIGSWALISSLGSASTGTAITGLAGAAATNATLAWFGGGALIAGGAGMWGGSLILAIITIIPVFILSSWFTYKQAKYHERNRERVIESIKKLNEAFLRLSASVNDVHAKRIEISSFCDHFIKSSNPLLKDFEPSGFLETFKYEMSWIFGRSTITQKQAEAREEIHQHTVNFLNRLAANGLL